MKRIACVICLLLVSAMASGVEPGACVNGTFPSFENIQYAEVTGDERGRSYFYDYYGACPEKTFCKQKTYIVKHDKVLVAELDDPRWVCVWYFGKKREFVGLMEKGDLKGLPQRTPSLQDWAGTWEPSAVGSEIKITVAEGGKLSVSGTATWEGRPVDGNPVVHVGEISGEGTPAGNRLTIGEGEARYDCVAKFQLVHGNLVVSDNGNCGGLNVGFTDIYRKHGRHPR